MFQGEGLVAAIGALCVLLAVLVLVLFQRLRTPGGQSRNPPRRSMGHDHVRGADEPSQKQPQQPSDFRFQDVLKILSELPDDTPLSDVKPTFERDSLGALISWRGSNAEIFPFTGIDSQEYVLRLPFRSGMREANRERYRALEALSASRRRSLGLLDTNLIEEALRDTNGVAIDAFVMQRVPGLPLAEFLSEHQGDPAKIRNVARRFAERVVLFQEVPRENGRLRSSFAHADLQSANVFVTEEAAIWFIDYDEIYLPGVPQSLSLGHENYQHPGRRPEDWGPYVDTFSALLIYVGLRAVAASPDLLDYSADNAVVFTGYDIARPADTDVWAALASVPDRRLQKDVERLAAWCRAARPPNEPFSIDGGTW